LKRCPTCGATVATEDRFCEADGSPLADVAQGAVAARPTCSACGAGTIEADGYCSACGRRAVTSRPTPAVIESGRALAGGVVLSSRAIDEYVVTMPESGTALVVLGEAGAIEHEADALERIGGSGVFPQVLECAVDGKYGSFLSLAMPPADAHPLGQVGPGYGLAQMTAVARGLLDAAQVVERLGFAWEPQRDDVFVREGGRLRVTRLRVPRKLGPGERLDARAVLEAVGATFLPEPLVRGPSRAFRLMLPHTSIPGDPGSSVDDVRAELAAIDREIPLPPDDGSRVAGVCDPGLRRPHNEDAMASARGATGGEPWTVLVVCDGVSSSSHAEQASAVASKTACDALAHFARIGDVAHEAGASAVAAAIRAAHIAVCAQEIDAGDGDPPGTTIVVGLVWRRRLTVGWVGDSRAYWVSDQGAELLTHDHSWANEAIARGEVTASEAALSPLAHALTRCLGPLEVDDPDAPADRARRRIQEVAPDVRARDLPGPGWIVLCSDGFWNYFPRADEVASLVRAAGDGASPADVARRLVNHALLRGGQDNTTVLVHQHR
jgi:serine/threonine protein phosphatase PrpC